MATAEMPSGPRSARLADDAATAALYAVQPRRKASVRDKPAPDSLNSNQRVIVPNLSHASAASALAHANHKPIEVWRPGRYTEAEKAALCVKDFSPPEFPQPSTGYSAEGLGAAILAVREQRSTQAAREKEIEVEQNRAREKERQSKALKAATGAYATRKKADAVASEPVITSEPRYARTAAGASRHISSEEEAQPLNHLDDAMEASRITHAANQNAKLYTSSPPNATDVQERNRRNSLHAAALVMARDMYDVSPTESKGATNVDPALSAAQKGHGQAMARSRNTVSGTVGTTGRNALTLQEAAQKRASEKLARLRNEQAEMQAYYGTAPQPQRSRLTTRRKRASSDADATQTDAEQSRHIRHQMTSLRSRVNRVDEKRQHDRDFLMEAARRNVDQTMQDMDMKLWADSGRAPPSRQKEWDDAAEARVRREAETSEASSVNANANATVERVNIGGNQYMDMADVEAVARSRLQPTFDGITDQAEQQRAHELEERLDAEEQERQAAIEEEREADMRAATKQKKDSSKRESKGINFFQLLRRKSRRVPDEKTEAEKETADKEATALPTGEDSQAAEGPAVATGAAAVTGAATTAETVPAVEITPTPEASNAPEVAPTIESARAEEDASTREIRNISPPGETIPPVETVASVPEDAAAKDASATEAQAPLGSSRLSGEEAAAPESVEEPETPGAATVFAAGPVAAPVKLVNDPVSLDETTGTLRYHPEPRDAAAVGGVSPMHTVQPIISPRADSKLKTWFRDRLVRRSSGPVPVYPHQPGPDFNTDSEIGFSGGATLREQSGSRSAALSSHPVTSDEFDQRSNSGAEVSKMSTYDSASSGQVEHSSSSKRQRLRSSFMKTVGRSNQDSKTNGVSSHSRNTSGAIPESKDTDPGIQNLRNSAIEQGLPVPPALGDNASATGRESRFSEDL
ncbi:hypothetical protein N7448_009498 [Penicillium atrosanguineum]|uniref:Eisosome protein 1 n=1 Tax=Penicillium atrosanguineum TaxID=1132637 RepID=A0A9W9KWJ7_9EURO|nr:uncharacterized protein N7443_006747 [Penicillium atrosanguineum]KAJ5123401.1 hypothetical protein N7448_009498 [Penicillium atrosanguineum]KAJ5142032.1 hypothetical protein N7526_003027 [Penicillium atrosanguineum]KAJ5298627.1 hypothetical protein N7443_006747 [Penicillium atrosanguineum]KAJ5321108.1 hypothetical protein N7476_004110 [Penicillium atrosanguineum]